MALIERRAPANRGDALLETESGVSWSYDAVFSLAARMAWRLSGAGVKRGDRVAAQAALAFAQVHRLRTESLRRASQAEHNAELATTARARAARMTQESRKYEAQGRVRSLAVPDAGDAFQDVHRFRVEALRRAHEAVHGAEAVAQARERATRLLREQRKIEAEMGRLNRGGVPSENL